MILLLVIAILVLLAVMGSVYVLMAGADRQSTNASNGNASLAMAQAAVLNIVRGQIGTQLTDGSGAYLGSPLALGTGTSSTPPYARTWDMPELGVTAGTISPASPSAFYMDTQDFNRSEPWLVSLPVWMSDSYFPPNTDIFWSGVNPYAIQTTVTPMEIGTFATQPLPAVYSDTSAPSGFNAVSSSSTPGVTYPLFSMLSPFLYDPATGLNDIGMSYQLTGAASAVTTPGTGGTVDVPNASVVFPAWSSNGGATNPYRVGIDDSCWNLLPYSSPNGTRYRFAVRIMDTNSMLNLNVGQVGTSASNPGYNPGGQYFNGYDMAYEYYPTGTPPYLTVNSIDPGANMALLAKARSNKGGFPGYTTLAPWQQALWTRDVGGTDSALISLFGTSSELALRAFQGSIPATGLASGVFTPATPLYDCRVGSVLPTTLGFNGYCRLGQPWKMFFTAYSKDRPLRTEPDLTLVSSPPAPYGLMYKNYYPVNSFNWQEWPQRPGKIFVNAPADSPALVAGSATNTNTVGADVPGGVALTAAQIAQAMRESKVGTSFFNGLQTLSFAANYMTYRMGVANGGTNGPSFIDASGPCVRGYNGTNGNFSGIGSFTAPSNEIVAGVAAQPFIIQAAINANVSKNSVTPNNYAVVLYNPFGAAINVSNWTVRILNGATYGATIPLTGSPSTIPSHGFLVINQQNIDFSVAPGVQRIRNGSLAFSSGTTSVVLCCPLLTRAGTTVQLPVDSFNVAPLMTDPAASFNAGNGVYSLQRNCVPGPSTTAGDWYCDNASRTIAPGTPPGQLGAATGTPMPPAFGIPLYDRFTDPADCPGYYGSPGYLTAGVSAATGSPVLNITDLGNCPTVANFATISGANYLPSSPLSAQVAALAVSGPNTNEPNTNLQYEANARFDFYDDPAATVPDPAAIRLLDYITFDSVFSDSSVSDGSNIYNKLAVPGRININTASLPVLEAMIGSVDTSTSGTNTPQALESDIDQYRLRLGSFSTVKGLGFHSKAELTYALSGALSSSPTSISARDNTTNFAELYNMATVRSDTFVCYTYIQALRLNEAYIQNGGTYNVTDWYNATQRIPLGSEGSIYNAQSVQSGTNTLYPEFILEGQKRFVALIDRTNATSNGAGATSSNPADPQVVSLQGLPQ